MTDETNVTGTDVVDNTDYIAAINELKQNSVDRSKYDQLKADNKRLLETLVNGQQLEVATPKAKPDIDALRKAAFKSDMTNLEQATAMMELRDALIESGEPDPALPWGKKIMPTSEDIETAERVCSILKSAIEYADGDSEVFTNELQRRMLDSYPMVKKGKK